MPENQGIYTDEYFDKHISSDVRTAHIDQYFIDKIRLHYIFGLALIAIVITLAYFAVETFIYEGKHIAEVINLSSKQRILAERVVLLNEIVSVSSDNTFKAVKLKEMKDLADDILERHKQLLHSSDKYGLLGGLSKDEKQFYYNKPFNLNSKLNDFLAIVYALVEVKPEDINANLSQVKFIAENGTDVLLPMFEQAIIVHETAGGKKIFFVSVVATFIWLVTILILFLEGIFIFRSAHKRTVSLLVCLLNYTRRVKGGKIAAERTSQHYHYDLTMHKEALNELPSIIFLTDIYGIIKTFNKKASKLFGYTATEIVKKKTPEIFHENSDMSKHAKELSQELGAEIAGGFETLIAKAKRGQVDDYLWLLKNKVGETFRMRLIYTCLFDEDGELAGYIAVGHKVSSWEWVEETA